MLWHVYFYTSDVYAMHMMCSTIMSFVVNYMSHKVNNRIKVIYRHMNKICIIKRIPFIAIYSKKNVEFS
jgi:hypothetical protein